MRQFYRIASWAVVVLASMFFVLPSSSAQCRNKPEKSGTKVARQLHPDSIQKEPPMGIKVLIGYKHEGSTDFEGNQIGEISKKDGAKIKYEMGFSQGLAADPNLKTKYLWYRELRVNRRTIRYALTKNAVLIISIPLSDDLNSLYAVNFYGTIRKPEDIADMLLMILPAVYR